MTFDNAVVPDTFLAAGRPAKGSFSGIDTGILSCERAGLIY